ncbi:Uncharacterised protein [Mycobacterium tuberculosis]|uniref:Uncharacterized protein n=1 Tax=Mycobacterium tuberculosis TaxID=1773 RepID=A0A916LH01_MYCTX|nr:Uncharacterised protein [Mycobacterium tuberculosis]CPB58638.1 Uncharacterised protein [Mycobacterium tuberculosis]
MCEQAPRTQDGNQFGRHLLGRFGQVLREFAGLARGHR